MRLGADFSQLDLDPEAYAAKYREWGYRAATCPKVGLHETDKIRALRAAFAQAGVVIGEVAAWVNPLDPRPAEQARNRQAIAEALAVADELGAVCCPTVAGSFDTTNALAPHVAPHPDNFTETAFEAVVEWVRKVLDEVQPRRAKLTLEMSPWTILDGPDIYLRLLQAIDRPGLAVHLDPANAVRDAHLYFSTTDLVNYSFDLLGQWIVSCHAKDVLQDPYPATVAIHEVIPGRGILDYGTILRRIEQVSPETPLIIEHLASEQEYAEAAAFLRGVAAEVGVTA
jgi:sugar phosphate isomerase/epimerase